MSCPTKKFLSAEGVVRRLVIRTSQSILSSSKEDQLNGKMAGVAEKARFYLERAVPQLQDFEEKEIFSKVHLTPNSKHHPLPLVPPLT